MSVDNDTAPPIFRGVVYVHTQSISRDGDIIKRHEKRDYTYAMNKQMFIKVATVVFTIVAAVHLYRAFNDLPVLFNTWVVPASLSWFVGLFAGLLAYSGYRFWNK